MTNTQHKRVAIIGAGVAGLTTAKALKQKGFHCSIYDRNSHLGGVWSDGYTGWGVQVQKDLYQFPDFPLPNDVPDFTSGPRFREYLESYCKHFGIQECLNLATRVIEANPQADGGWALSLETGGMKSTVTADFVVVATGLYSETPLVPDLEGKENFSGEIHHSSDIRDIEMLRDRRVAVVGYGKSATDIAASAVPVAKDVHLVFRTAHWPVPRKLLGLLPFKWGMLTRLVAALIPPYVRPSPAVKLLHTIGYPLPWLFWRVVELLLRFQQRLDTKIAGGRNLVPDHPVEFDAYSEKTMVPRPGLIDLVRSGKIAAHRSGLKQFTASQLVLDDGDALDVDSIVFATGWETGNAFLPDEVLAALNPGSDGFYLYRHMLHPSIPDLAFVGRASSFMSVSTYALQARWLAEVLSRNIDLPSAATMNEAISDLAKWKRSWMPEGPARSATLLLHMMQYHDELLTDMGHDPLRKQGLLAPLKEIFVPYSTSDFKEVV